MKRIFMFLLLCVPFSQCLAAPESTDCDLKVVARFSANEATAGSTINLYIRVENNGTNVMTLKTNSIPYVLIDRSGNNYELKPFHGGIISVDSNTAESRSIAPASFFEWPVTLQLGKEITAGKYQLKPVKVTVFTSGKQECSAMSSSPRIEIRN